MVGGEVRRALTPTDAHLGLQVAHDREPVDPVTPRPASTATTSSRSSWESPPCASSAVVALSAETVLGALEQGTARFDASDLMPSAVGAGSFWEGMNDWMRGEDLHEVLTEIEQSRSR